MTPKTAWPVWQCTAVDPTGEPQHALISVVSRFGWPSRQPSVTVTRGGLEAAGAKVVDASINVTNCSIKRGLTLLHMHSRLLMCAPLAMHIVVAVRSLLTPDALFFRSR